MTASGVPRRILPVIVLSQFAGTSLWLTVNAVLPDLERQWSLPAGAVATLTSAVQLGFVAGTLVFALLMIADRHRPERVFLVCSLLGAAANAAIVVVPGDYAVLLASRFATGFLLAGIYPVGMKIAASWYRGGLGAALGVLVGALVLGSALPHGLRALAGSAGAGAALPPWQSVVLGVSLLAVLGGVATAVFVPPSPQATAAARTAPISIAALGSIWFDRRLRASVFGYFGHMGELYAFIVLVPAIAATRVAEGSATSALAFAAIGAGTVGCIAGGLVARRAGSARVAQAQLAASAACCLVAPFMLAAPLALFVAWLLVWGTTVAGDSPQFSTLTARNAPPALVGSVLTLTNCIGFAISIVGIEVYVRAANAWSLASVLPWLAVGPAIGLLMLRPLVREKEAGVP